MRIIEQPEDQFAGVGGVAIFNCGYNESTSIPYWVINGRAHSVDGWLPSRHSYSQYEQRLTVSNVQQSDNNTSYKCSFGSVSSRTAKLIVIQTPTGKSF